MAATRNAGELVCGIFELLEDILLRIDMKTLLLSQRVNKTFRFTIEASNQLQQQLFLQPLPIGKQYRCTKKNCFYACLRRGVHINPLLSKGSPINLSEHSEKGPKSRASGTGWALDRRSTFRVDLEDSFDPPALTLWTNVPVRQSSFKIMSGSWINMLMTQPGTSPVFVRRDRYGTMVKEVASKVTGPQRVGDMLERYWPRC
ncbi:hypothetical protein LTR15_006719 [Elasticomyces elasticus]|nr:hypothetical protein LTR15_006719 [Elasticomyces elasticus]